jgi:2-polyprenyl-6-hydroxyphenyl methylase/3-demethylubiquinone-9 3-methyltransferase
MTIGQLIRRIFGPLDKFVSEAYRAIFIDLADLARQIRREARASKILEVGCGEGIFTKHLAREYPDAEIVGIDITPRVGRMFDGDVSRVVFKQQSIRDFAATSPAAVDLVVIVDVLHHILEDHKEFLIQAKKALKPGGYVVVKEWERRPTFIHMVAYVMDRYIGWSPVNFMTAAEFRDLIKDVFGPDSITYETRIPPRPNNITFFIQLP